MVNQIPKIPSYYVKNVCILTSSRKGYFQFTLLNRLLHFHSNLSTSSSNFEENTVNFHSSFYHVKASRALRWKLKCLSQFCTLREARKTQPPSFVQLNTPPKKNQNKEVGSVISTRTNRNCLLHLRHPSIKLLLGGSQALYHHCLSNSVFSGGQIQHPLTAARATPLTSPGTSSNCLDFS